MTHDELKRDAREAIGRLTGDTSVSQSQTLEDLEDLIAEMQDSCTVLREEIRSDEESAMSAGDSEV